MAEQVAKKARIEEVENKSVLDQLKEITVIVADTGEFSLIKQFSPQDATTNPSLIFKAAQIPEYHALIDNAIDYGNKQAANLNISEKQKLDLIMDKLVVNFGNEISKLVPGYVSMEVDARLSFDTEKTLHRARQIISLAKELGMDTKKILIKVAATYEGIQAGKILQEEGISCNLTLVFSLVQAALCAENSITLISPFVGRILDWHKSKYNKQYSGNEDPGVLSVRTIYQYFKQFHYSTIVMGASFRNTGEIVALAGCDRLTIAPSLLSELSQQHTAITRVLHPTIVSDEPFVKLPTDEASFRFLLNEDAMATEKLSEGIRLFAADITKLEKIISDKLASCFPR